MDKEKSKLIAHIFGTLWVYGTITFVWFFVLALIYETWLRPALGW